MTSETNSRLDTEQLQQLLVAARSGQAEDTTCADATEYDWNTPHYFTRSQLDRITSFTEKVVIVATENFRALYREDINVTVGSISQKSASQFLAQKEEEQQTCCYVAITTEQNKPCGFLSMPLDSAIAWVIQLLGDQQGGKKTDNKPTKLEESLLYDTASVLIQAFTETYGGERYHPADDLLKDCPLMELHGTEELCSVVFNIGRADAQNPSEVHLWIFCEEMVPVAGKDAQSLNLRSEQEIREDIVEHLRQTRFSVEARLGTAALSFADIVNLQPGDILLLDTKIDQPLKLVVEGLELLNASPAKADGAYAVVVTEIASDQNE